MGPGQHLLRGPHEGGQGRHGRPQIGAMPSRSSSPRLRTTTARTSISAVHRWPTPHRADREAAGVPGVESAQNMYACRPTAGTLCARAWRWTPWWPRALAISRSTRCHWLRFSNGTKLLASIPESKGADIDVPLIWLLIDEFG